MWFLGAMLTTVCFGINNSIFKWSTGKGYSKVNLQLLFYASALILTFAYGMATKALHFNVMAILLGILIGVLNANGNIQMSKAFEKGPASLTAPIISANTVFPVLSAGLIFHEKISISQWLGILLILASVVVIQYTPKRPSGKTNYLPWIGRISLAVLSFGILGVLMKLAANLHISSIDILVSMYGGGSIYLLLLNASAKEKMSKAEVKLGALVGAISVAGYGSYFFALQTGIASIVYPLVSLNCLMVVLAGCILFKEKMRSYQIVGVLSALLGVVLTKI
ncbi:EamA family transporter [Bacillus sp. T33-2]|uniref:EamA family transporter n=1 Tax=Bacillus sp. T33-2 TaxID=2054168 RepID=UPI000C78A093|nr:EamA family transporter [Bacillus sp. T33-2]PLR94875.1 EamA family transporter [Bacillus sp. T33-2]